MAVGDPLLDFPTIAAGLVTWVAESTQIPAARVIWADQDHPRPARPYAELAFVSPPVKLGGPEERHDLHKQVVTITVDNALQQTYAVRLKPNSDGTAAFVPHSYAAGLGDSSQDIRDGLVSAVNAGSIASAAPGATADDLVVTGLVDGDHLFAEVDPVADLSIVLTTDNLEQVTYFPGELFVRVTVVAALDERAPSMAQHAAALMNRAQSDLWTYARQTALETAKCPPVRELGVGMAPALRGISRETRAYLDVAFSVALGTSAEPGTIEVAGPITGSLAP